MNPNIEFQKGIEALRNEMPDVGVAHRTLLAIRRPPKRNAWAGPVSATAVLAIGLVFAWPKPSAASSLDPIVQAVRSAPRWMCTVYTKESMGKEVWASVTVRLGDTERTTYNPKVRGMSPQGELSITYSKGKRIRKYADRQTVDSHPNQSETVPEQLIDSFANHQLVKSVEQSKNVSEGGRLYDRYLVAWTATPIQRTGQLAVYTNPGSKLPVKMIGVSGNSLGLHAEWVYGDIPPEFRPD